MSTRILRLISISYLLISVLIFLANWFKAEYSLIFIAGHIVFFAFYSKSMISPDETYIPIKSLFLMGAIAFIWSLLTGTGGFFMQTSDYEIHNSKFYDLFIHQWPLLVPEKETFSCYYYGYYLVPSMMFKLTGSISPSVIIIYTSLGLWIGLSWLYLLLYRNILVLIIFILCGGICFSLELISLGLFRSSLSANSILSLFTQSIYAPNQTIAVLITTGIFLYYIRDNRISFYVITLSFLWGVFPAAVLSLLLGVKFLADFFTKKDRPDLRSFILGYILPGILFLPVFIFLTSSNQIPIHEFHDFGKPNSWTPYSEIIIMGLILFWLIRMQPSHKNQIPVIVLVASLVMLGILLSFRLGNFNDLFNRGNMPLFSIILISIFQMLIVNLKCDFPSNNHIGSKRMLLFPVGYWRKYGLVTIWVSICCLAAIYQLKNMSNSNTFLQTYTPIPYNTSVNSYQAMIRLNGIKDANQYLGNPNSFYYMHLAKKNN